MWIHYTDNLDLCCFHLLELETILFLDHHKWNVWFVIYQNLLGQSSFQFFLVYLKYSWLVYECTKHILLLSCTLTAAARNPQAKFSLVLLLLLFSITRPIQLDRRSIGQNFLGKKNPSTWHQIIAFCITALEDDTFSHNSYLAFKSCLNQVNLIHDLAVKNGRIKRRLKQLTINTKAKWFWQKNWWLAKSLWHFSSSYPKNEFQFHLIPILAIEMSDTKTELFFNSNFHRYD